MIFLIRYCYQKPTHIKLQEMDEQDNFLKGSNKTIKKKFFNYNF